MMGGWIGTWPDKKRVKGRKQYRDNWPGRSARPIGKIDITRLPHSEHSPHPLEDAWQTQQSAPAQKSK